jgi:H+/Cl- antiporter ClcA
MIRIIITATLIVLLAVLVAFNLKFTTSISIYGAQFTDVPVMVIALLSFALGVMYSLFLYVGRYLNRRSRKGLEQRHLEVSRREQELSARGSPGDSPASPAASAQGAPAGEAAASPPASGGLRGLFRRRRVDR